MPVNDDLLAWLRGLCAEYSCDAAAVFRREGNHDWPLHAVDAEDLQRQLESGGHFLPLPKEPASLANVLEVSFVRYLVERTADEQGISVRQGTERGYPDVELSGERLGGGFHAIDIKAAQRKPLKRSAPNSTKSRITLYTGNTYFKWPQLQWPGMLRPFDAYESHVDVVFLYTLDEHSLARAQTSSCSSRSHGGSPRASDHRRRASTSAQSRASSVSVTAKATSRARMSSMRSGDRSSSRRRRPCTNSSAS